MNLGERLFNFLEQTCGHLTDYGNSTRSDPLYDLLNENLDLLDLLRSTPEYVEHLARSTSAFAFLPNEIINDVVIIAGEHQDPETHLPDYRSLSFLAGPWGHFARRPFLTATADAENLRIVAKNYRSGRIEEMEIPLSEIGNQSICHTVLANGSDTAWKQLQTLQLHGSITITRYTWIPEQLLQKMETCWFTSIDNESDSSGRSYNFLKRQLQSKHLKELCTACRFEDDVLVEFVSRPSFEKLVLYGRSNELEFPVFKALVESWKSKKLLEAHRQEIRSLISYDTAEDIAKLFDSYRDFNRTDGLQSKFQVTKPHPRIPHAKANLKMSGNYETYVWLTLFSANGACSDDCSDDRSDDCSDDRSDDESTENIVVIRRR